MIRRRATFFFAMAIPFFVLLGAGCSGSDEQEDGTAFEDETESEAEEVGSSSDAVSSGCPVKRVRGCSGDARWIVSMCPGYPVLAYPAKKIRSCAKEKKTCLSPKTNEAYCSRT